jgi:hypothetical protein
VLKKTDGRRGRTFRDADVPSPKNIDPKDMQAIFEVYEVPFHKQPQMREALNLIITKCRQELQGGLRQRSRKDDRKNLLNSIKQLRDAQAYLDACGTIGRGIASKGVKSLGTMLSYSWLRKTFPTEEHIWPSENAKSRLLPRTLVTQLDIEQRTLEARFWLAKKRNILLISAVLAEIQRSLEGALIASREGGGRKPSLYRHYFIRRLAYVWVEAGRDIAAPGPFHFQQFCEHIFEYIGWQTSGLRPAIRKAVADL